jgi:MFS family permease
MTFNIGVIIGPILGGLLADPAGTYPSIFGHIEWLKKYPYAPPNLLSAFFLFCAAMGLFFGLNEVCLLLTRSTVNSTPLIFTRLLNPCATKRTWARNAVARLWKYSAGAVLTRLIHILL